MDWDLKVPAAWELADLDAHDAAPSSGARHANAAGNGRAPAGGRPECSVDLNLGHGGAAALAADRRSREPSATGKAPAPSSTAVAAAGAANNKRHRPAGGGGQ
jgi:hypothetical protein